jgi:hypothetical protein
MVTRSLDYARRFEPRAIAEAMMQVARRVVEG